MAIGTDSEDGMSACHCLRCGATTWNFVDIFADKNGNMMGAWTCPRCGKKYGPNEENWSPNV